MEDRFCKDNDCNMERIAAIRDSGGITITIKSKKNWPLLVFLVVWLSGWTFGGIAAVVALITGSNRDPFLFVWLCGWCVGECLALIIWFWTAFGQEIISIRQGTFCHKREIFGQGIVRSYQVNELFNLRASGFFGDNGFSGSLAQYGLTGGTVAVDTRYGESHRFGIKLEEREAFSLAKMLEPYLQRKQPTAWSGLAGE